MRCCPRKAFLPANYQREAHIDAPVRLEELDFNVSAPHMHATCLEALDLKPGLKQVSCCLIASPILGT